MKLSKGSLLGFTLLTSATILSQTSAFAAGGQKMPARQVGYEVVKTHPVTMMTERPGRTLASYTSDVRPQVTGIITKVLFNEGSTVTKGEALYQIDPAQYQVALESAKASLLSAKASLMTATSTFKRYENLIKKKAVSKSEYDNQHAAYLQAQAQVKQAQASVKSAQINLDYTRVTSPISGRIGRSNFTEGALVTANQATALVTVQTFDPMYVDLTSSANDLLAFRRAVSEGTYKTGDDKQENNIELHFEDGTVYPLKGKFLFTDINVDKTTSSFVIRAEFPNPHNILLPGLFVRTKAPQGTIEQGITVPLISVMRTVKGDPYVYVLNEKNTVSSRPVSTGSMTSTDWIILKGLKAGEKVITSGLQFVRPGAPVTNPVNMTDKAQSKQEK